MIKVLQLLNKHTTILQLQLSLLILNSISFNSKSGKVQGYCKHHMGITSLGILDAMWPFTAQLIIAQHKSTQIYTNKKITELIIKTRSRTPGQITTNDQVSLGKQHKQKKFFKNISAKT